ncbi:coiled-coil domain-containing protein 96 [Pristis pectinata]|uniref:coiled-coil domain-containing protein 96 n=1 Tax=Pristis pectinata TaxID=685728 RepID=UPI00223CFF72|nr:coiled-coil domain-containing protein 96 [Pristis pectinata]
MKEDQLIEENEGEIEDAGGPQTAEIQASAAGPLGQKDGQEGSEILQEERKQVDIVKIVRDDGVKEVNLLSGNEEASQEISGSKSELSSFVEQEIKDTLQVIITKISSEETSEMERQSTSALPSTESFTEGEKEGSLPVIGEDLSPESTPEEGTFTSSPPTIETVTPETAATPVTEVIDDQNEEDEQDKQKGGHRKEMELKYKDLIAEQEKLKNDNQQIQNKLADYYKKKAEESKIELKKPQADYDQRYLKFMDLLAKVQVTYKEELALFEEQIGDLNAKCEEQQQLTDYAWKMFQSKKKVVAKTAINKRPGRQAALQELEHIQNVEEQKEKEMRQTRFLTIKMKNKLKYYEHQLKAREELADGLNLIDYEQLKIENQSYSEKIEERMEEVTKMKKKIAATIEVLTHIREKLEYVEKENAEKKTQLREVEAAVAQKREILTKTKQARDRVRTANLELKEKCGLLCNKLLLRDLEDNVDANERLQHKLEELKRRHTDLTLNSYGIKKKIEWVKLGQLQAQ